MFVALWATSFYGTEINFNRTFIQPKKAYRGRIKACFTFFKESDTILMFRME